MINLFFIGSFLWPILSAGSCIWEHYFCWLDTFKWQSEINNVNTGFPCSIDLLGPKSLNTHLYQSFNYREVWQKVTQIDECLQEGVSLLSVIDQQHTTKKKYLLWRYHSNTRDESDMYRHNPLLGTVKGRGLRNIFV